MPTQNLLRLLLLLMLMQRIVLATVYWRFWSWGLVINLNFVHILSTEFGQDFKVEVQARFWSWSLVSILPLMFCWGYEVESWLRLWSKICNILNFKFNRWLRFWSFCFVEILDMKFDQDLCLNLWCDPLGYFAKMNSTLGSVVPLAMFHILLPSELSLH